MQDELSAILASDLPDQDNEQKLATLLYNRCYTVSIFDPPNAPADTQDLTPSLAAANQSRAAWDAGWKIDQVLDAGQILARKGGAARSFLPGEFITQRGLGTGPAADAKVTVFLAPGSADLQPAYYYAFSETAGESGESEQIVRFFWNISPAGAAPLMETITRKLNRFQVPFRFKCACRTSDFPRRDAAVLYLHARYYPVTAMIVQSVHSELRPWLGSGTPLFSKHLADGLGFAEDPGESFGDNRTRILAAAMIRTRGRPVGERLAELHRQFQQRHLSLEQPWLNAGSVDRYDFPFPVT